MKKLICTLLCCLLLAGLLPLSASASIRVEGSTDITIYCGGIFDLYAVPDGGIEGCTFQWQFDASMGNGSWYDLEESTDIHGYHGVTTHHLQFASYAQDGTHELGTGWENVPFRCKVTKGGDVGYTQAMYMRMYPHSDGMKHISGFGLYEPTVEGARNLSTNDYEKYTAAATAGTKLSVVAGCEQPKSSGSDYYLYCSEVVFTPEVWITENGKTVRGDYTASYTPYTIGKDAVTIEVKLHLMMGVNDLGYCETKTIKVTTEAPNPIALGTMKQSGSLLREMYNESQKLVSIPKDANVSIVGKVGSWYQIHYGKYVGYVPVTSVKAEREVLESETIKKVNLTVDNPVIGNVPWYNPPVSPDSCELYYNDPVQWYDKTTGQFMKPSETFKEGHAYRLQVWVSAKAGCQFPVDPYGNIQVTAYVNDQMAKVYKAYEQDPSEVIEISYDFGELVAIHTCKPIPVLKVEPTCTKNGQEAHYRCECGISYADSSGKTQIEPTTWGIIPATGHTPGEWTGNEGYHARRCAVCREIMTDTTAAHTGGKAACERQAICTVCAMPYGVFGSHTYSSEWIALGDEGHAHLCTGTNCGTHDGVKAHTPGAAATETTAQTCTACGYVLAPAKSHTHQLTKVEAKQAGCTTGGNLEYYTCSGCSDWFKDAAGKEKIANKDGINKAPTGHQAGDWQYNQTDHWKNCIVCGEAAVSGKEAHADGDSDKSCDICGYILEAANTLPPAPKVEAPSTTPVTPEDEPESDPEVSVPALNPEETPEKAPEEEKASGGSLLSTMLIALGCFLAAGGVTAVLLKKKR